MVVFTIKELDIMKEKKIKLVSIADAKTFVTAAMKCDFDVDVFYNRVVIDGKYIWRQLHRQRKKSHKTGFKSSCLPDYPEAAA